MNTVEINVTFCVGSYSLRPKIYDLHPNDSIRQFKTIIINDLEKMGIGVPPEDSINYGFCRLNIHGHQLFFLGESIPVETLLEPKGMAIAGSVKFTMRRRTEYPQAINWQKILRINKRKHQKKFLDAISLENIELINDYLRNGLDPNFCLGENSVPLFRWCTTRSSFQEAILNLLIEFGVHLDFRNSFGECVSHFAVKNENRSAVKLLILKGVCLDDWNSEGIPAIFLALSRDIHPNFLEFILSIHPNIDIKDSSGNNPLHHCARHSLESHLTVLFKHLSSIMIPHEYYKIFTALNKSGKAPIHVCVIWSNVGCLKQFARFPFCLELLTPDNESLLDLAASLHDNSIMQVLEDIKNGQVKHQNSQNSLGYDISLEYCKKKYSTFKKANKPLPKEIVLPYPASYSVTNKCNPVHSNELLLLPGQYIHVILMLKTNIGFGFHMKNQVRQYGWFPLFAINMVEEKAIKKFQKEIGSFEKICSIMPEFSVVTDCNFIPVLVFISLFHNESSIGMELGVKSQINNGSAGDVPLCSQASPFYVRNIAPKGPADRSGMRIGDQILYIMSNEVTTFSAKVVISLIKKLCHAKIPNNVPKNSCRQICFIVLRHGDTQPCPIDFLRTVDFYSDSSSLSELSPSDTISRMSVEVNPLFCLPPLKAMQEKFIVPYSTLRKGQGIHRRPLPEIPKNNIIDDDIFIPPPPDTSSSSIESDSFSIDSLPPPPL